MIEKLLMKLNARDRLGPEEETALREAAGPAIELGADKVVIRAGEELTRSTLLLDGVMCRFKDLRDGSRQICELHVAGDFVDLHSFTLKRLDHNIMTLTPCRLTTIAHARLKLITERYPHLTRLLWYSTNIDAAIHRESMLSLGRRSALARTAHFFCELLQRLRLVGLTDGLSYALPITQLDLAECLGLTSVHVNRVLKRLREQRLVAFRRGRVEIEDYDGLAATGEFNPSYLYLERQPQ
jgi:CRP-like cAMP-binding protein